MIRPTPAQVLENNGLTLENLDDVYTLPASRLERIVQDCIEALPGHRPGVPTPFTFTANGHLSGAAVPCSGFECRFPPAMALARFAALYADHVIIRNPFDPHRHDGPLDFDSPDLRFSLHGDFGACLAFAPLVEAGLASFSRSDEKFCPICVYEVARRGDLADFVGAEAADGWQGIVGRMVARLRVEFEERTQGYLNAGEDPPIVEFTGDTDLIPHGCIVHRAVHLPKSWMRGAKRRPKALTPKQLWKARIYQPYIEDIIDDLTIMDQVSRASGAGYITDRDVDFALMDEVGTEESRKVNRRLLDALGHPLPFLDALPLVEIIRVRRQEGEAFQVYRDSVEKLVREAAQDPDQVREAFLDTVRPQLNQLDVVVKNASRSLRRSATIEGAVGVAALSIALFTGVMPAEWAQVFTALGGVAGITRAGSSAAASLRQPREVRNHPMFFLWKVRQQLGRHA